MRASAQILTNAAAVQRPACRGSRTTSKHIRKTRSPDSSNNAARASWSLRAQPAMSPAKSASSTATSGGIRAGLLCTGLLSSGEARGYTGCAIPVGPRVSPKEPTSRRCARASAWRRSRPGRWQAPTNGDLLPLARLCNARTSALCGCPDAHSPFWPDVFPSTPPRVFRRQSAHRRCRSCILANDADIAA